ncbi:MAG: hypothetical protein JO317_07800 [Verrucomicrobiae bacterium]|nr:hypothetical protein [Verrucomicrobiae bacterium]
MIAHIHQALAQVRELKQRVLEKQRFKGYSGRARALAGTAALAAAIVMSSPPYPRTTLAHLVGWGVVFLIGFALNYGALLYWFWFDPEARHPRSGVPLIHHDLRRLKPAIDAVPPLFAGGILTYAALLNGQAQLLFGIWMILFGLANTASHSSLPRSIFFVGLYYVACGAAFLLLRGSFLNPWPIGVVFFVGEWAGGLILHFDGLTNASLEGFVNQFLLSRAAKDEHEE